MVEDGLASGHVKVAGHDCEFSVTSAETADGGSQHVVDNM